MRLSKLTSILFKILLVSALVVPFSYSEVISEIIKNDSKSPLLCVENKPAVYGEKEVKGISKKVKLSPATQTQTIVNPNDEYPVPSKGNVDCYNHQKSTISVNGIVSEESEKAIASRNMREKYFNPLIYRGMTRKTLTNALGIPQWCKSLINGEYCNLYFGVNVTFNDEGNLKSVYFDKGALSNLSPSFSMDSVYHLRNSSKPLMLETISIWKGLLFDPPLISSRSTIVWIDPIDGIKNIILSANYRPPYRSQRDKDNINANNSKLQLIEVNYF